MIMIGWLGNSSWMWCYLELNLERGFIVGMARRVGVLGEEKWEKRCSSLTISMKNCSALWP